MISRGHCSLELSRMKIYLVCAASHVTKAACRLKVGHNHSDTELPLMPKTLAAQQTG